VKSTVERKESLLDEVAEEETELKLGLMKEKRQVSGEEARTNPSKTPGTDSSAQPNPVKPSKVALKYPKKQMLKALPASGATESGEVKKEKRMRVESSTEKVTEVARFVKGIWLGIEEEKSKTKKAKCKLEKELAQAKTEAMKGVRQLKAFHIMAIGKLKVKAKANLDEMVEEHDRLGRHLMLKGYSEEEVDAIKADTYAEDGDDEEVEAVGVVDGLDGISRQTVLDNQGDDVEFPEGGSEKVVRETSLRINDLESGLAREKETFKALMSAQADLQRHVQKGNANLRECQHKLDASLIREKVLEGEINAKESLVKRKE
ncbi:hypothetical protein GIB67_022976, partial [Kingdonia uniflora]